MDSAELIASIESAFGGIAKPETSLRQFWLTDQFGMSREISDREWTDAGKRRIDSQWQDIPDAEIEECGSLLAHMQAPDFQYYLPAYMRFAIRHLQSPASESEIAGSVAFLVYPSAKDSSLRSYTLSQLSLLTQAQRQAMVDFLHFISTNGGNSDRRQASVALERFWTPQIVQNGIDTSVIVIAK